MISGIYTFVISDGTAPQINDIFIELSNPLDTEPGFGWINISCVVSDDEINKVHLVISNPDISISNMSMILGTSGQYYFNTTFTVYGNYSYHIWVNDTSNNHNTSSVSLLSIPPNWDINIDGNVTVLDFILISNHFNEMGNPGWIRQDINNNGVIKVLDIVLASNHYGAEWR